ARRRRLRVEAKREALVVERSAASTRRAKRAVHDGVSEGRRLRRENDVSPFDPHLLDATEKARRVLAARRTARADEDRPGRERAVLLADARGQANEIVLDDGARRRARVGDHDGRRNNRIGGLGAHLVVVRRSRAARAEREDGKKEEGT